MIRRLLYGQVNCCSGALMQKLVVGKVDLQWCDRDKTLVHGDTIGAVVMGEAQIVAADPIILDRRADRFFRRCFRCSGACPCESTSNP